MRLPSVDNPSRYRSLYVFDFGEWTALGYTAEEIAVLLESPEYRDGQVYKIHRAWPDGRMELRGVSKDRLRAESGLFFYRQNLTAARADFALLHQAAERTPLPCRAKLHLAERSSVEGAARYVTALIFPADYEDEVAQWLTDLAYGGGDLAEGGISHVSNYYQEQHTVLDRQQLWSASSIPSRSAEQVLASVRRTVQR